MLSRWWSLRLLPGLRRIIVLTLTYGVYPLSDGRLIRGNLVYLLGYSWIGFLASKLLLYNHATLVATSRWNLTLNRIPACFELLRQRRLWFSMYLNFYFMLIALCMMTNLYRLTSLRKPFEVVRYLVIYWRWYETSHRWSSSKVIYRGLNCLIWY